MDILLIEPDLYVAVPRKEFLEKCGYSVGIAGEIDEAVNVLKTCGGVRLVIIHYLMPRMFLQCLKSGREGFHSIILSEFPLEKYEADAAMVEPVEDDQLFRQVAVLLAH